MLITLILSIYNLHNIVDYFKTVAFDDLDNVSKYRIGIFYRSII